MKLNKKLVKFLCSAPLVITVPSFAATDSAHPLKDIPINRYIKHSPSKNVGAIIPGAGFSHDTQQIPPNVCYDTVVTATTGQQGTINLKTAMSFTDIEKLLHFSVEADGDFGMFSAEADADYLRTIQDLDYSLSLNYSEFLYDTVMDRLVGPGQHALTESGKEIYNDASINKYFGILCGDDYISAYQQGASLLMGLNIRFSSHFDKEQFSAHASASFGDLINASTQIQTMASQYNIHGTVIIEAYQKGGDPAQLSKILAKDKSGVYYALSCDLQHMGNCVKAANGLLTYAVDDFPQQVSFNPDKGLVPLGNGFVTHDPITEYGLTPPPSLVTKDVIDNRTYLATALKANQFYQQKLNGLINGYPVPWATNTDMYKSLVKLYQTATNNIDAITSPGNPDDGALKCYNHPELCQATTQAIKAQTQTITDADLKVIEPLRYSVWVNFLLQALYPVNIPNNFSGFDAGGHRSIGGHIEYTPQQMTVGISIYNPYASFARGTLNYDLNNNYTGRLMEDSGTPINNVIMQLMNNPYFFGIYNPQRL